MSALKYTIREAKPEEFVVVGNLMVEVYSQLEGFPKKEEQPNYYNTLSNVGDFTLKPKVKLLVAVSENNLIDGAVVYFGDMLYYGSGGKATSEKSAAGFRLLAVSRNARGKGIGKLLSTYCIDLAKSQKQEQLIIHSTRAMQIAWSMYEKLGSKRSKDLDFKQADLQVYGFRLQFIT